MELIDSLKIGNNRNVFTLPYAVCDTAGDIAAKTVTCDNFVLATGAMIVIKFMYDHTATSMTLSVNGGTAKYVYYSGAHVDSGKVAAYNVYTFIYDGTYFRILGVTVDVDHIVGAGMVSSSNSDSKLFLVGTTTQSSDGKRGYSNISCYASGGSLYSEGTKVALDGHTHLSEININASQVSNLSSFVSGGGILNVTRQMFDINEYTNGTLIKLNLAADILTTTAIGRLFTAFTLPVTNSSGYTINASFNMNAPIDIGFGEAKEFTFILTNFDPDAVNGVADGGRVTVAKCIPISWTRPTIYYESYAPSLHTHTYSDVGAASSSHSHTSQNYAVNYGTCSTTGSTAAKTVTITGIGTAPSSGTRITVRFTQANSASTPTLSVNGSANRSIMSPSSSMNWCAGAIIDFVYYFGSWYMMSPTPQRYYTTSASTASGGLGTS